MKDKRKKALTQTPTKARVKGTQNSTKTINLLSFNYNTSIYWRKLR